MAMIEGIRIKNFRTLKDVQLGRLQSDKKKAKEALTPLTVVIGKNGVGKTSLFDVFGFLSDCLNNGVEYACDARGGFDRIRSKGVKEPVEFEVYYKENSPISYWLNIDLDASGRPYVVSERLSQRRSGEGGKTVGKGKPLDFLRLENGAGLVWAGETALDDNKTETSARNEVHLTDNRVLGISSLGILKEHPRIQRFRDFLKGWYLSYFHPDAARSLPTAGIQRHLNKSGDNLGNVVQYMEREHGSKFKEILKKIADRIPGISSITTEVTTDKRLLLCFNGQSFSDPFYQQQMSDGTLKMFAYLLLINDPDPYPFICIEEPENGLYHKLLEVLAQEFRYHAEATKHRSQLLVTTHEPYFIDALRPEEVWILEKGSDGFSTVRRASDDELVSNMVAEGLPLGGLWYSDYLDGK